MSRFHRQTFSLESSTVDDIRLISNHLGITKSALVNQLLGPACDDILRIIERLPAGDSDAGDRRRLRGASVEVIESRLSELSAQVQELRDTHEGG
jgi:hypothetical protein